MGRVVYTLFFLLIGFPCFAQDAGVSVPITASQNKSPASQNKSPGSQNESPGNPPKSLAASAEKKVSPIGVAARPSNNVVSVDTDNTEKDADKRKTDTDSESKDTDRPLPDTRGLTPDTDSAAKSSPEEVEAPLKAEIPADRLPTIKTVVSPASGAIGDLIEWRVIAKRREEDRIVVPADVSFGKLEIKNRDSQIESVEGGWVTEVITVRLISFDLGEFDISAVKIIAVDKNGNMSELLTDPVKVTIKSLIANEPEPQLKPDMGPGEVVWEDDYTLVYIGVGLGGILLVALLTLLGLKLWSMRKPKPGPPPPPPRPAEEIVLEKLNRLKDSHFLDDGKHKEFHLVLSEAFREYLGNRYRFDSLERSTEELILEIRQQGLSPEVHTQVIELLNDTDLVKFAKFIPTIDDSRKTLDDAYKVVDVTTISTAGRENAGSQSASSTLESENNKPESGGDADA